MPITTPDEDELEELELLLEEELELLLEDELELELLLLEDELELLLLEDELELLLEDELGWVTRPPPHAVKASITDNAPTGNNLFIFELP